MDDAPGVPQVAAPPPSVQTLTVNLVCCCCGYNLRGLPSDGLCPECATVITLSVRGRRLDTSDRGWLHLACRGAALFAYGLLALDVALGVWTYRPHRHEMLIFAIIIPLSALVAALGAALAVTGEPDRKWFDDALWLRRVLALLALAALVIMPICACLAGAIRLGLDSWPVRYSLRDTYMLAALDLLAVSSLMMWYLAALSARLPSRTMVLAGRSLSVLNPAIAALITCCILLPHSPVAMRLEPWIPTIGSALPAIPATYALLWRWIVHHRQHIPPTPSVA